MDYKQKIKDSEIERDALQKDFDIINVEIDKMTIERNAMGNAIGGINQVITFYRSKLKGNESAAASMSTHVPPSEILSVKNTLLMNTELAITKKIDCFTHSTDLGDMLLPFYPTRGKTEEDKDKFFRQLSGLLSLLKRRRRINSFSPTGSKKNTLWGRNEWFDEKGKPIQDYLKEKAQQHG